VADNRIEDLYALDDRLLVTVSDVDPSAASATGRSTRRAVLCVTTVAMLCGLGFTVATP